jgi:hypothetical protein
MGLWPRKPSPLLGLRPILIFVARKTAFGFWPLALGFVSVFSANRHTANNQMLCFSPRPSGEIFWLSPYLNDSVAGF